MTKYEPMRLGNCKCPIDLCECGAWPFPHCLTHPQYPRDNGQHLYIKQTELDVNTIRRAEIKRQNRIKAQAEKRAETDIDEPERDYCP